MGAYSYEDIKNLLLKGDKNKYSHLVIVCDTWDYEDYPIFVNYDKDIYDVINEHSKNMEKVMGVYNYNLDLESQLDETRAYHIEPIIKRKINNTEEFSSEIVKKAFNFATLKHKDQYRKFTNKEYITHPIEVVNLLEKYKESHEIESLKAAGYLHDTIEDTDTTFYELVNEFGYLIAGLVTELTTNKDMKNEMGKNKYLACKLKSMSNWALDIKLCDRFSNISDLDNQNVEQEFRNKYIKETLYIMLYIANNRELTLTHKTIIKDMILKIKNIINNNIVKLNDYDIKELELLIQKK